MFKKWLGALELPNSLARVSWTTQTRVSERWMISWSAPECQPLPFSLWEAFLEWIAVTWQCRTMLLPLRTTRYCFEDRPKTRSECFPNLSTRSSHSFVREPWQDVGSRPSRAARLDHNPPMPC